MEWNGVTSQAQEDFAKARGRAWIHDLQHCLHPDKKRLLSLHDVKKLIKSKNEVYMGVKAVPIHKIIGSEGRYNDFDNCFLPLSNALKQRWVHVDTAHLTDIILPPVQLYEIAGVYFVRDGNHRVSVAKAQGVEFIDAEIISLQSEIQLPIHVRYDTLLQTVIEYEKRIFYAETHFGDITDYWTLNFTKVGQYEEIYHHILVHKYYLNEQKTEEIPFNEALFSWFQTVYMPIITIVKKYHILSDFKNRTESDMYIWIVGHWDELKQKNGNDYSLDAAAQDFFEKRKPMKKTFFSRIKKMLAKKSSMRRKRNMPCPHNKE